MTSSYFFPILQQTREAWDVLRKAFDWVKTVKGRLEFYSAGDAMKLTENYDRTHGIACNEPAGKETINKIIILRAFNALMRGDKDVDQYVLFKAIDRRAPARTSHKRL